MASKLLKTPKQLNDHIDSLIRELTPQDADEPFLFEWQTESLDVLDAIKLALEASKEQIKAKVPLKQMNEHVDQLTKLANYYLKPPVVREREKDPTPGFNRYVAKLSADALGKKILVGLKQLRAILMRRERGQEYVAEAKQIATNRKKFADDAKLFKSTMATKKKEHKEIRKGIAKSSKGTL